MPNRITSLAHRCVIAPAIACAAVFALLPAARADQQTSDEEKNYALSWRAATGHQDAYALAPSARAQVIHRRHL